MPAKENLLEMHYLTQKPPLKVNHTFAPPGHCAHCIAICLSINRTAVTSEFSCYLWVYKIFLKKWGFSKLFSTVSPATGVISEAQAATGVIGEAQAAGRETTALRTSVEC